MLNIMNLFYYFAGYGRCLFVVMPSATAVVESIKMLFVSRAQISKSKNTRGTLPFLFSLFEKRASERARFFASSLPVF
jgi:hypothetical protein